ncbi:MAG: hypothetical protein ACOYL6_16900 [Bacteriovoracaceae bacterium]
MEMKKILIGLLVFGSISAFAGNCDVAIDEKQSIPEELQKILEDKDYNIVNLKQIEICNNEGSCKKEWFDLKLNRVSNPDRIFSFYTATSPLFPRIALNPQIKRTYLFFNAPEVKYKDIKNGDHFNDPSKFLNKLKKRIPKCDSDNVNDINHDTAIIINEPSLGESIRFSSTSDQNGVCISLGYQRAAVGSAVEALNSVGPVVVVNSIGEIIGGDDTREIGSHWIKKIICVNKVSGVTTFPEKVSSPKVPYTNLNYSHLSDQNGICMSMGYQRAAVGSATKWNSASGRVAVVNKFGKIIDYKYPTVPNGYWINNIICINKNPNLKRAVILTNPKHPTNIPFSSKSSEEGICLSLGYKSGVIGSAEEALNSVGPVVVVNRKGAIIGGEDTSEKGSYWIMKISCYLE